MHVCIGASVYKAQVIISLYIIDMITCFTEAHLGRIKMFFI